MGDTRDPRKTGWTVWVGDTNVAGVGVHDVVEEPVTLRVWRMDEEGLWHSTTVEIPGPGEQPTTRIEHFDPKQMEVDNDG